ncbi:DUF4365 domain-containing protein [Anaerococcus lactolyticus]|uniref:DUF4365 domain-containing protein n=1 Tax=Anaerococcus lactolyticus S7-1-13 TaxID=1284686 RepID=A0A095YFJ3_9FIRM|nr:DUF4365 domain-containing protein [Anaerococcus lactolyticus]KGF05282.1 hypothetical protein HMPREF1630_01225 [Anaerococcus lactolyticus S7-1-13]
MNNKDIETLSVNAVRECITITDHLEQSISDNDKEPSWDGSIIIYGDKKGDKSKILGKVTVQVKGKRESKQSKNEISYKMKVSDLRNYLTDGGCFLFMVYINPNNMKKKIYYNALTPIKLERILENVVEQKTKSIRLKNFPLDNNKKENILLNFHNDCKRQTSFRRIDYIEIEEIGKIKSIEEIIIPLVSITKPVSYKMLLENEIYFYAKKEGNSTLIPINALPKVNTISNYIDCNISIDNKTYYDKMRIIRKIDGITLCIGESLKLIFKDMEDKFKICYEISDKARILAKDLDFNLKMLEAGYFKINDEEIAIDKDKILYENYDTEKLNQNLAFAKDAVKVLDILGCDDDICLDDLDEKDMNYLNMLIDAFIYDKSIKGIDNLKSPVSYVCVGGLKFYLYFEETKTKNEYKVHNFFDRYLPSTYCKNGNKSESFDVSQFVILNKNDFLTASNIDFDKIVLDFKKVKHNSITFSIANDFLLELLAAADIAERKRKVKILEACNNFALWIKEAPDDELEDEIKTMNLLQVYKRQRDLTDEEEDELYEILENNSDNKQYMVGAYLLLGQQRQAERFFNKMSNDERNKFKEYPMYHFWNE